MKKLTLLAIIPLALVSCKKEPKVINKIDPTTGDTIKVEVASKEDSIKVVEEMKAVSAIKENAEGLYTQGFNLEKGKTYPFVSQQNQNISLKTPDGKTQKMSSKTIDEITFTVDDIKQDVYEITINFIGKSSSQSANGKSVSVDTKKAPPKEERLKNQWTLDKAMTGNTLKMTMNKSGEILSIIGFDPIYKKITTAVNQLTQEQKIRKQLIEGSKASFNEEVLKTQFSKNMIILPKKGVKLNSSWTESENASADGKVKLSTHYRLKSIDDNVATIVVSGGIPKQSDKQTQQGVTRTVSSEFSQNGSLRFDMNTGWIISQDVQIKTVQTESLTDGKKTESVSETNTSKIMVNPKNL